MAWTKLVFSGFIPVRRQAAIVALAIWPNAWMLLALGGLAMLLHFPRGE